MAFDRDRVVVVNPAEIVELQVARERGGFAGNPFHQVAVATLVVDIEVEQFVAGFVVSCAEPFAGDSHPHAVAATLAQRTGCGFDTGRVAMFRMSRSSTRKLPEVFQVIKRNRQFVCNFAIFNLFHAGQMQH